MTTYILGSSNMYQQVGTDESNISDYHCIITSAKMILSDICYKLPSKLTEKCKKIREESVVESQHKHMMSQLSLSQLACKLHTSKIYPLIPGMVVPLPDSLSLSLSLSFTIRYTHTHTHTHTQKVQNCGQSCCCSTFQSQLNYN